MQHGLDRKVAGTVATLGEGMNATELDLEIQTGDRIQLQAPLDADCEIGNSCLRNTNQHPVSIARRHLVDGIPLLQHSTQALRRVTGNDQSIKRCLDFDTVKLVLDQFELGLGLRNLGGQDVDAGALVVGNCLLQLFLQLVALGQPACSLQDKLAIIEQDQHLALLDLISGTRPGLGQVTIVRHGEHTLVIRFQLCLGGEAIVTLLEGKEKREHGNDSKRRLAPIGFRSETSPELPTQRGQHALPG